MVALRAEVEEMRATNKKQVGKVTDAEGRYQQLLNTMAKPSTTGLYMAPQTEASGIVSVSMPSLAGAHHLQGTEWESLVKQLLAEYPEGLALVGFSEARKHRHGGVDLKSVQPCAKLKRALIGYVSGIEYDDNYSAVKLISLEIASRTTDCSKSPARAAIETSAVDRMVSAVPAAVGATLEDIIQAHIPSMHRDMPGRESMLRDFAQGASSIDPAVQQ